jgi:hypothetical protein
MKFPLTGKGRGGGPLELKIKRIKIKKHNLRLAEDPPITFSLTGTGRGVGPLPLNIKKNKKN